MTSKEVKEFLSKIGKKGGKNGSKNLTPEQRSKRAKNASITYWKRKYPDRYRDPIS